MRLTVRIGLLLLGAFAFMGSGCREQHAPDPPRSRAELTRQLLFALQRQDYQISLTKIMRLRELDPANIYLAKLEAIIRNNITIGQIQTLLNAKKLDQAQQAVNIALHDHGQLEKLLATSQEIKQLREIESIGQAIVNPANAEQLTKNIQSLQKLTENYPPAKLFTPFIAKKLALARKMNIFETKRARCHLLLDIKTMSAMNAAETMVLYAQLALESPDHPELRQMPDLLDKIIAKKKY